MAVRRRRDPEGSVRLDGGGSLGVSPPRGRARPKDPAGARRTRYLEVADFFVTVSIANSCRIDRRF